MEVSDQFLVNAFLSSFVDSFRLGIIYAVPLTLLDEPSFHLSNHTKNRQYQVAHLSAGGYVRVENGYKRAALLTLVNYIEYVTSITTEPIDSGY